MKLDIETCFVLRENAEAMKVLVIIFYVFAKVSLSCDVIPSSGNLSI